MNRAVIEAAVAELARVSQEAVSLARGLQALLDSTSDQSITVEIGPAVRRRRRPQEDDPEGIVAAPAAALIPPSVSALAAPPPDAAGEVGPPASEPVEDVDDRPGRVEMRRAFLLAAVADFGEQTAPLALATALKRSVASVTNDLRWLMENGRLERVERGQYRVRVNGAPSDATPPAEALLTSLQVK